MQTTVNLPDSLYQKSRAWRPREELRWSNLDDPLACRLVMLCRPPNRNKTDLDPLIQSARDSAKHCQGVAFVIGVLKPADD